MNRTKTSIYFDFIKIIDEFSKKSKSWNNIDEMFPFHWWNQNTSMFLSVSSFKWHFFGVFRIKNIMFDDVLVPSVVCAQAWIIRCHSDFSLLVLLPASSITKILLLAAPFVLYLMDIIVHSRERRALASQGILNQQIILVRVPRC